MKNALIFSFFLVTLAFSACSGGQQTGNQAEAAEQQHDHQPAASAEGNQEKKPLSPRLTAMGNIGEAHVHIDYSSPSVRGRTIWGGLVAFDQVWATGAHQATSISFSKDVTINGQRVPAGTYGFFTIPGREAWTVILNKNYEQHLADDYDQALDVLRLTVTPEQLAEPVESLTYTVESTGSVSVRWERVKISFAVKGL